MRASLAAFVLVALSLVAACGGGGGGHDDAPLRVGILHSTSDAAVGDTVAKLLAFGEFASVTAVNCSAATPSLAEVEEDFDVLLVFGDVFFADAGDMGDLLADAVDSGIGVVLAVFTTAFPSSVGGRFESDGYFAIVGPESQTDSDGPIGWDAEVPAHPLLTDVITFGGGTSSYRPGSGTIVVPGSVVVATWLDAESTPLIVERELPNGRIRVDLGMFPVTSDGLAGGLAVASDAMRMVANALLRVGDRL